MYINNYNEKKTEVIYNKLYMISKGKLLGFFEEHNTTYAAVESTQTQTRVQR